MLNGEVFEIAFVNDHEQLRGGDGCGKVGSPLTAPHWVKGGVNNPVTYTQGATMSVKVTVKVQPAGTRYKLFGIEQKMFFNFESDPTVATGMPQTFTLKAKAPLPRRIAELKSNTIWKAATVSVPQQSVDLGTTGEHSVFVLLADPIVKNSMGYPNYLTVNRIRKAGVASGLNDVAQIAKCVQTFVNAQDALGTSQKVTGIQYDNPESANQIWSLLDSDTTAHGHCGEASFLMEQMLRLLGIRAVQKHVYGRTDKADLDRGENLSYNDEVTRKKVGTGVQVRTCKVHGSEQLWLNFTPMLGVYSLNWAEGTVELGGKLYAGLVDVVGEATGGVTASHDLLLKLQKKYPKFQVWSFDGSRGKVCELPATRSGGDPFPHVPSRTPTLSSPNRNKRSLHRIAR